MTDIDETTKRTAESQEGSLDRACLSRRGMLRSATLGGLSLPLLAACGGGDEGGSPSEGTGSGTASPSASASSGSAGGGGGGMTVATSDVPVGGGAIFPDDKLVVTQPAKGEFKAFSAVCTHQGCVVSEVTDGQIVCKCHGSHFSISDGEPVGGPAEAPLGAKKVAVKGGEITVT
jgi:nitrite reductase/ring-hydroxylating ferredoxin subunit